MHIKRQGLSQSITHLLVALRPPGRREDVLLRLYPLLEVLRHLVAQGHVELAAQQVLQGSHRKERGLGVRCEVPSPATRGQVELAT